MKRIKLTVAYDGTNYSGWQIQPNASTIEAVLDEAIQQVTGENIHVTGASRTDARVHALGNVAVFDTASTIPADRWAYVINRFLPEDVSVVESREVKPDFHPRHCNTLKTYEYKILSGTFPIPQLRNSAWHITFSPDIKKMREAAKLLVGEHDFKSFCCVRTQVESTVRTIYSIDIIESPYLMLPSAADTQNSAVNLPETDAGNNQKNISHRLITIRITGNGFLYNMVRIIAGTLIQVGRGQLEVSDISEMLERKDRTAAGQTAPPQGLTLMNIKYVDNDDEKYNSCG